MDERTGTVSGNEDTQAIRRDIERTQREMSRTIEEIQHRLSPSYMMERTKQSVKEAGVKTSRGIIDKIKSNPLPAAMVGIGLYLLSRDSDDSKGAGFDYSRNSSGRDPLGYGDFDRSAMNSARDKVSEVTDDAHRAVHNAKESAQETMHDLADRAQELGARAGQSVRNAGVQTRDVLQENPLVLGLIAAALGAVVGSLIPETQKENELMGATRDRLADRGKELVRGGVDRAKDVAASVTSAATEAAKEATKGETAAGSAGSMSGRTDVVQNVGIGTGPATAR